MEAIWITNKGAQHPQRHRRGQHVDRDERTVSLPRASQPYGIVIAAQDGHRSYVALGGEPAELCSGSTPLGTHRGAISNVGSRTRVTWP